MDVMKKLKAEANARQRSGGAAAAAPPRFTPGGSFFVSNNWKKLLADKPSVAPRAAETSVPQPRSSGAAGNLVALDCEMVGIGAAGTDSRLARLSIVDNEGNVLVDKFVRPDEPVTDYRSHITGITEETLQGPNVLTETQALERAAAIMKDKIVVGHAVNNDFEVLRLDHPHHLVRDTALFKPLRPKGREKKTPSLARLTEHWLHQSIHTGSHDSVEDARMALRLYNLKRPEWEKQFQCLMKEAAVATAAAVAAVRAEAAQPGRAAAAAADSDDDAGECISRDAAKPAAAGNKTENLGKKARARAKRQAEEAEEEKAKDAKKQAKTAKAQAKIAAASAAAAVARAAVAAEAAPASKAKSPQSGNAKTVSAPLVKRADETVKKKVKSVKKRGKR